MHHKYLIDTIICYSILFNDIFRSNFLVISFFISHTYFLYPWYISLWVTARVSPLPCTTIFWSVLMIFQLWMNFRTGLFWNNFLLILLSRDLTFSLWCDNFWKKPPQFFFQRFDSKWSFILYHSSFLVHALEPVYYSNW